VKCDVAVIVTLSVDMSHDRVQKDISQQIIFSCLSDVSTLIVIDVLQAGLMATHGTIVNQISQEMNGRYLALQKQHQEFAAHLNGQITALEHQLMMHSQCILVSVEMSTDEFT